MFGLIGHSTSFEDARRKALELGYDDFAAGDLDVWCSAPPQLVEYVKVKSPTGKTIEGAYIDSCFVPEMLTRFKTARRKVLNAMELVQKKGLNITALGGFTSIIFENFNLLQHQHVRSTTLEWDRFTTGNTHTAWVICRQLENNAPSLGIDLAKARVAVVGATGDIGSAVCRWLSVRTGVAELLLVARQQQPLLELQNELGGGRILALEEALPEADVVVWVASMPRTLEIDATKLQKPCLMIDGGYPKNLDTKFSGEGVHVLKGG
ncbi:MAG TPA: long-chain acyl-[acyl-carrier-protein] reductase, partial [Prochlorococcaceae cyanobacterium Fu_MAG_134]|nr:long-chain acyl-[acyl-carrier-protein] reductase [Prochlorococcaceae cyanobacterium Fu_MAG_134]